MGRQRKYFTKEQKLEARRIFSKKYYWKNKEAEDAKARLRYKLKKFGDNSEIA